MRRDRGFALLAVLWLVVLLSGLAATTVLGARTAASTTSNRVALTRARWAAEGCLAATLAYLDSTLRVSQEVGLPPPGSLWYANGARCTATVLDPSTRLNVDSATPDMLARFDSALAGEMRETSGVVYPETFRSRRDSLLTSEGNGRINLNTAPAPVLGALPGFGAEAVRVVLERRAWGEGMTDLFQVIARLSPPAREAVLARYGEVLRRVAFAPSMLVVRAEGWVEGSRPRASVEALVVPAGMRAAVVRRRMW
jgi:type II secretory pathway component PulK